jgi:arylsulfatase A-like enzyme
VEGVVDMSPFGGRTVEIVLTAQGRGGGAPDTVYWATPILLVGSRRRPNVILISIDSLRADHLGCYGYGRRTSPTLDSLASRGYLFERAISQSPWTLPSHASLLTSLYVRTHGVCRPEVGLDARAETLAERLRAANYLTAAFASGPFLLPEYGLNQGFDMYDARCSSAGHGESYHDVTNPCIRSRVAQWLWRWGEAPFFLFIHYWDVHFDYIPPAPYDTLFDPDYKGGVTGRDFVNNDAVVEGMDPRDLAHLVALYDGEIAHTDRHIGLLLRDLEDLGLTGRTLLIVTSDHGDEFLEHGGKGHAHSLFQELIHVPIIWVDPEGVRGPRRIDDVVQLIDLAPSILQYLGLEVPTAAEGRSFVGRLRGDSPEPRTAFSETKTGGYLKAALERDTKAIHSALAGTTTVYDLRADPGERHPRAPGTLPGGSRLHAALSSFVEEGAATIEIRVYGAGSADRCVVSLEFNEPPLALEPQGLEQTDSLSIRDANAILDLVCSRDDVDGATLVLPGITTTVEVDGTFQGRALRPAEVLLGGEHRLDELPVRVSAGDGRLASPGSQAQAPLQSRPLVHLWTPDTRDLTVAGVNLDEATAEHLRALGYLR